MGRRIRARGRAAALLGAVGTVALLAMLSGSALGSSVSSASFTAGGVVVNGVRYAKSGQQVTLTVNTSSDTKCVEVTGAHTDTQTSSTPKSSWTFTFTARAGDGLQQVTAAASPNVNNQNKCTGQSQNPGSASYRLDNTGPQVTASATPAANAAGWRKDNVSITWSASDSGSGVASGPTPASDSVTANTAGVTKTSSDTDRLGNVGQGSVSVKLDKDKPSIAASQDPGANADGWNNSNVTVNFNCSDALSGIKSCSAPVSISTEGANQPVSGTAVDNADNSESAQKSVSIDKTDPSLSGAPVGSPNSAG
jgi:hypothetical protein